MNHLAEWLVAVGTLVLATVAVFQETIRSWFYRPRFNVRVRCEPPDCVKIPFTHNGQFLADTVHLRIWVQNDGNATARNAEVYAKELTRQRADRLWESITAFPPMNLAWANVGEMYFPSISPRMGKHCDVAHITDPQHRAHPLIGEDNPVLGLTPQQVSLAFNLIVKPNHRGHIVGPDTYRLALQIAAENARPVHRVVEINVPGPWYSDESKMLRGGVGIRVLD
jgi:hypothetical protein